MSYIIYPYIGVNSIRFGMTKEEIHSELGNPETTFMRNSYDNTGETEEYKDFFVCYDEDERCEAIEFFELADIILNGKAIFTGTYDEICGLFDDIEEDNTGFTEYKYGIGVYAPDKDETVCYPESVIVFKKGYYD